MEIRNILRRLKIFFKGCYESGIKLLTSVITIEEYNVFPYRNNCHELQDIKELLEKIGAIELTFDRELANSVLEVSIKANRQAVEELRRDGSMCQALLEIMEPEINKIKETVKEDTKKNAILCAVKSFRDFGVSDDQIKGVLIKNYQLSSAEADEYL